MTLLADPARRLLLRTAGAGLATVSALARAAPGAHSTVDVTEGPFFVDERLERWDIRSDPVDGRLQPGLQLDLAITVSQLDTATGATRPLPDVIVDLWHCNARGLYSDAAENDSVGRRFLRGHQVSDAAGRVRFRTIYPGWYGGRSPHIHCKVRQRGAGGVPTEALTTQFFFDEALSRAVYATAAYATGRSGSPDTTNATDPVYQGGNDCLPGALAGDALTLAAARGPHSARAAFELLIDAGHRCLSDEPGGPGRPGGPSRPPPGRPPGPGGRPPLPRRTSATP